MDDNLFDSFWPTPSSQQYSYQPYLVSLQEIDPDQFVGVESTIRPIIDSPIESQTTPQAESSNIISQQQGGEIPNIRANNTIFKTGVSCYRKSIVEYIKRHPSLKPLLEDIQEVCKGKNMSVFSKLNFMVRWLNLEGVAGIWAEMKEKVLEKKRKRHENRQFSMQRLNELEEVIKKMNECIKEEDFDKAFERYWGKFRQLSKHLICKEKVLKFCKKFEKANPEGKMGKRKPEKKETQKKKTKSSKKTKKTNTIKTKPIRKTNKNTSN